MNTGAEPRLGSSCPGSTTEMRGKLTANREQQPPVEQQQSLLSTVIRWEGFGKQVDISPRPTQPQTLSGTGNEYQPKCGDALWLGVKGRYGSSNLWINVWVNCVIPH